MHCFKISMRRQSTKSIEDRSDNYNSNVHICIVSRFLLEDKAQNLLKHPLQFKINQE